MIGTSQGRHFCAMPIIERADIPAIDLYMDQVTTFMETHLSACKRGPEDKILTKTMINNYAKAKLFPPPKKKKYTPHHIMLLIMIYHLKGVLCISDIQSLLQPINEALEERDDPSLLLDTYDAFLIMQRALQNAGPKTPISADGLHAGLQGKETAENKPLLTVLFWGLWAATAKRLAENTLDRQTALKRRSKEKEVDEKK